MIPRSTGRDEMLRPAQGTNEIIFDDPKISHTLSARTKPMPSPKPKIIHGSRARAGRSIDRARAVREAGSGPAQERLDGRRCDRPMTSAISA